MAARYVCGGCGRECNRVPGWYLTGFVDKGYTSKPLCTACRNRNRVKFVTCSALNALRREIGADRLNEIMGLQPEEG